jgi:protein phosphatase
MKIDLPDFSLVLLIGPSSSGKSTFARRWFLPTEVVSSDACRALIADDENDLSAIQPGFELLHNIVDLRLQRRLLTVVDATNTQREGRRKLIQLARDRHALPCAIAFDLDPAVLLERHAARTDRAEMHPRVIDRQRREMRQSLRGLNREGIRHVWTLRSPDEVEAVELTRTPLFSRKLEETGPFDIIGDIHGCRAELEALLAKLGWELGAEGWAHPEGRKAVFLGDLVDRGPDSPGVLRIVMQMCRAGRALCMPGNHDDKLKRALAGRKVTVNHGLEMTLAQMEGESEEFRTEVCAFLDGLTSHAVLAGGRLVTAHAGMPEDMQGRGSGRVRDFALYGDTTGEEDEEGFLIRGRWAEDYRGKALVAYGHTAVPEPEWLNNTVNLDTGCVYGGALSALRWPEKEIVQAPAERAYAEGRVLSAPKEAPPSAGLDLEPYLFRLRVPTALAGPVLIPHENLAAAMEVMSRFAAHPRWVIHLPPTMSPCRTSRRDGWLEHPDEALDYFAEHGMSQVVCQEKHMGSRALAVVCRSAEAASQRFGAENGEAGRILSRTGRAFFTDESLEAELLAHVRGAAEEAGLFAELDSDWMLLDLELMPWSAKAQGLIERQFMPAGEAARASAADALAAAQAALARGTQDLDAPLQTLQRALGEAEAYEAAWRGYVKPVGSAADYRLAPFHLLASEGAAHFDKPHAWHLERLDLLAAVGGPILVKTDRIEGNPHDASDRERITAWWMEKTAAGAEGMVVKPADFIARGPKGTLQPALKCRGREYLRIIYGPAYDRPESLSLLRVRGLGAKRRLAAKEFALGVESLTRFTAREPLARVHECALAVLALESEPIDARL